MFGSKPKLMPFFQTSHSFFILFFQLSLRHSSTFGWGQREKMGFIVSQISALESSFYLPQFTLIAHGQSFCFYTLTWNTKQQHARQLDSCHAFSQTQQHFGDIYDTWFVQSVSKNFVKHFGIHLNERYRHKRKNIFIIINILLQGTLQKAFWKHK